MTVNQSAESASEGKAVIVHQLVLQKKMHSCSVLFSSAHKAGKRSNKFLPDMLLVPGDLPHCVLS